MSRNVIPHLTTILATSAALVLACSGCGKSAQTKSTFPVPVAAAEVLVQDTTNYAKYIGQTRGESDIDIRARVPGFLESVRFTEGTLVRSNTLLYTIDDGPYQVAVNQAEAQLAQAEAVLHKAMQDTNRLGPLWERHAISRQQYDDAITSERSAAATVQAAAASLEAAKLQLGYTKIHAPIEGLVGKTEVKPGNLVGQGTPTLLTTISSLDPIHVRFSVSEKIYLEWRRRYDPDKKGQDKVFELILADGTVFPEKGHPIFADRQVDPATGTLLLEVSFPNSQRLVRPGQFARVRFPLEVLRNAVLIPQSCVQELQANYSVFVVGPDNTAQFRRIVIGPRIETFYVVRAGLKPGEKVITEGIQKVQNGVPLAVTMTNLGPVFLASKSHNTLWR